MNDHLCDSCTGTQPECNGKPLCDINSGLIVECNKYSEGYCTWANSEGIDSDDTDTCWKTYCGHEFIINMGTPEDNNMEYCCYCGKPVEQLIEE